MSVGANLVYGFKRREANGITLVHIAELLDLNDLLGRFPQSLSGGQQQRVALGRAILSNPDLLLMDEPVNAQHAELKEKITEYLRRLVAEFQIPVIFVSHDLAHIRTVADALVDLSCAARPPHGLGTSIGTGNPRGLS
jgi:molybdate transport system ATP-binding protein